MGIRIFLFFIILLSSCKRDEKQKVIINYDYRSVRIENEMFFIDKIIIFNNYGKHLYKLQLKDGEIGSNNVFLFQHNDMYIEQGSLKQIENEDLKTFINIEIQSRDKQKIEVFEDVFELNSKGEKVVAPLKELLP